MSSPSYSLFCIGDPLLDIQVRNGEELLKKYDLKANDAIRAGEKQAGIYDELVAKYDVAYVAGGASQNSARGVAYMHPPGSVVYTGAVGDDALADQLRESNKRAGLDAVYQVKKGEKTGACAVIITGHHRSLVTNLCAAEKFDASHLSTPEVAPLIENAKFFYIEGYFLTHGIDTALQLSKKVSAAGKMLILNISAPFIAQFFSAQLGQIIHYADIVIGNEAEAESWANANSFSDPKDIAGIAKAIALLPKADTRRGRVVVFTQGSLKTVLVTSEKPDEPMTFPVSVLSDEQIVDTNGAGDAFAGGFLGAQAAGKKLDESVLAGHALARLCVQQVGPQFPWPKVNILENFIS